jgi:uncharacterized protein (DUF1778 family)
MPPDSKQVQINMRVPANLVRLIDVAAEIEGVNRTAFITSAATARAEDVLFNGPDESARIKKAQAFEDALDSYSPR